MLTHADIVEEVKGWVGTKYHHLGRVKGAGVDCAGLIIGVAHAVGISPDVDVKNYSRLPNSVDMKKYLDLYLDRIELKDARAGDILFMRFANETPQHLDIISEYENGEIVKIIHSYTQVRRCCEHHYDAVWKKRTVAAYRYKGVS